MKKDTRSYNILVIEDNEGDFTLIEDYLLEKIAIPVIVQAKNFTEARSLLARQPVDYYDIIFLDLSLPDKDGEPLIIELLGLCPECPVIILTGNTDIDFSIKSLSLGIADYLLKDDINATSLYKSIVYNIERKKTNTALEESEKRYSNLFHLSPQPVLIFNTETFRFVQVNKAAVKQYGYSEKEFLGMTVMDIMVPEELADFKKPVEGKKQNKEKVFNGRFRHYKKTKELIPVEMYSNDIVLNDKIYKLVIAIDVTENVITEHTITKAIIKAQEEERYEIGNELHDNICQILATSQIILGTLKESVGPTSMQWLNQCREYIVLASNEIRNLSHRLAPAFFDNTTLDEAFRRLLTDFNTGEMYKIGFHFDSSVKQNLLSQDAQLNLYRILQEQLRNILKHAAAAAIEVELIIRETILIMRIQDDGIGFDADKVQKGIGLANMKRRTELFSGKLIIDSLPGKGCLVTVQIPLQAMEER